MEQGSKFNLADLFDNDISLRLYANSPTRMMFKKEPIDLYQKLFEEDPLDALGETKFRTPRIVSEDVVGTPIQEFFRGAHVFITGGTGFIGKILTEKLVRSVPHLGQIYLLIRAKRGKSTLQRFEQLLEDPVFRRMKAEVPDYASKLTVVEGDISAPELGLSAADKRTLLDHVTVVFHSAADVRFIEPLRVAISSNVNGSRSMMTLARRMTKLKSYVHVSTAFSQCVRRVVPEAVPKMSISYREVLTLIDSLTDEEIEKDLYKIMQGWPNTYTFTKALCEEMMMEEGLGLPICIFRPAAVISTYQEPIRGWIDNMYGPVGLVIAMGMGVLHCFRQDEEMYLDMVPVDSVVNCMIACACQNRVTRHREDITVYNFVIAPSLRMSWKALRKFGCKYAFMWPSQHNVWFTSSFMTTSYLLDAVSHVFLHRIPGAVLDRLAVLKGERPRIAGAVLRPVANLLLGNVFYGLGKIYDRVQSLKKHLKFFAVRLWEFDRENVTNLWLSLDEEDKKEFNFDFRSGDPSEQLMISKLGVRYYFLKEKMETLPAAEKKVKVLYWAHIGLKAVSSYIVLKAMVMLAHVLPI